MTAILFLLAAHRASASSVPSTAPTRGRRLPPAPELASELTRVVVLIPLGGMWLVDGLVNAARMAWEVWWALVLGFALSGDRAGVGSPRRALERALGGRGPREISLATGLGAASSSCSYAAIAIAKSLFQKGASLASAMAFQFASTNLVFELGLVLWLFLGWQFTLAEFVGGILLILADVGAPAPPRVARARGGGARACASGADGARASDGAIGCASRLASGLSDVALNFRADLEMLWKEIAAGFVIAGYVSLLPTGFFNGLFITDAGRRCGSSRTCSSGRSSPRSRSSARSGTFRSRRCSGAAGSRSRA